MKDVNAEFLAIQKKKDARLFKQGFSFVKRAVANGAVYIAPPQDKLRIPAWVEGYRAASVTFPGYKFQS